MTEELAKKGVEDYLSLPPNVAETLFPPKQGDKDDDASKREMTPDTVKKALANGGLTPNQEAYLKRLQENWPNADGKPITLEQLVTTAGYSLDPKADNYLGKHEKEEHAQVQQFLDSVSNNINLKQDFDNQPITQEAIDKRMKAIADGNHGSPDRLDDNEEYQALSQLKAHFNDLSRDGGKTVTQADLESYASAYGDKFNGFKPDDSGTGTGTGNGDQIPQNVKDAFNRLPKELHLGQDGRYLYDLASASLYARAALTGEPTDQKAVWREVARLVIDNADSLGVSQQSVDYLKHKLSNPNATISSRDLPAVLNNMRSGQTFKVYTEDELTRYEKEVADKTKANTSNV